MQRLFLLFIITLLAANFSYADRVGVISDTGEASLIEKVRAELPEIELPDSQFEARRQAERAATRAQAYLRSIGYYNAQISYAVEAGPPLAPMIKVEPGKRFKLRKIDIDVVDRPHLTPNILPTLSLSPGSAAAARDVVLQEGALVSALKREGYADAKALERQVTGSREDAALDVVYRFEAGPKVRLGKVLFNDGQRTRRVYLERMIPFKEGDVYAPTSLAEFNTRLSATRLYKVASARLKPSQTSNPKSKDKEDIRDVEVTLEERPRYTLGLGGRLSSDEGPGLTANITRRNASRRADTLRLNSATSAQERSVKLDWNIPHALAYNKGLSFNADAIREETDAYDREAIELTSAIEVIQSQKLSYTAGLSSEYSKEVDVFTRNSVQTTDREFQILSVFATARLDHSDHPLDPSQGWRAQARIEPAFSIGEDASQFFTATAQLTAYQALTRSKKWIVAGRVQTGFVFGADLDTLPASRRFFAGGGGSARGFEYQSLGPIEPNTNDPTGGRGLLESSAELRWSGNGSLGYAAFVDAATVSGNQSPAFDDLRFAVGVGLRYQTPIGPIRVDLATPLDRRSGEDPVQLYINIGQAF